MRGILFLMGVLMAGGAVQAQSSMDSDKDGKVTLTEYLASAVKSKEKQGAVFNEEASKKFFNRKDLNKDGVLSADELAATPAPKVKSK